VVTTTDVSGEPIGSTFFGKVEEWILPKKNVANLSPTELESHSLFYVCVSHENNTDISALFAVHSQVL